MFVVFDTNVWLAELGLCSPAASATKFYLKQTGNIVVIPEIVRLETEYHLTTRLMEFTKHIRDDHRQPLTTFGTLKEIILPTDDEIKRKVSEIFDSFNVEKREVPFGIHSARSSMLKTITKCPPSDKTQEFKDGVIWADCLTLMNEGEVVLVTSDKAFYKERSYEKGLADSLKAELGSRKYLFQLLPSLSDLLEGIRKPILFDAESLLEACMEAEPKTINKMLEMNGFLVSRKEAPKYRIFATEDPDKLFFEYTYRLPCEDVGSGGRMNAIFC